MKKFLMLACVTLFGQQANSQYFQRTYGGVTTNEYNAQFVTATMPTAFPLPPTGPGYVMVGRYFDPMLVGAMNELHMVHTNNAGLVPAGAPYFNAHFLLTDRATTQVCDAWATSIDELPGAVIGTFDYVVAGNITVPNPNQMNFFVLRMNAAGVIAWIYRYSFPNFVFRDPKLQMDNANANILVTGRAYDRGAPAQLSDIFAFSIVAANGNINWGMTYDLRPCVTCASYDDVGNDITENPFAANEALIVGSSSNDGLLLRINRLTGALAPIPVTRYNHPGSVSQTLNCINQSGNPLNASPFIVGGSVLWANPQQNDAWTMLIDQNGVITWSTTHDTGLPGAPLDNTLNEIMERFNNNPIPPVYEYYTAGTVQTNAANSDVQTLKLNGATGFLVAGGEFIYGTAVDNEQGNDIHIAQGAAGFALSGNTSLRAADQLLLKAYFNGIQPVMPAPPCPFSIQTFTSNNPTLNLNYPIAVLDSNPQRDTVDATSTSLPMSTICFANAAAGGSNLKVAPTYPAAKDDDGFNFTVLGTGTEEGVSTGSDIRITVQNNSAPVTARIIDQLGREYPCRTTYGDNGEIKLSGNLPQSGMYYIILSNGKESKSKAVFVK